MAFANGKASLGVLLLFLAPGAGLASRKLTRGDEAMPAQLGELGTCAARRKTRTHRLITRTFGDSMKPLLLPLICLPPMTTFAQTRPSELAPTPPMGWNSWNTFQTHIDEKLIKDTADAMIKNG